MKLTFRTRMLSVLVALAFSPAMVGVAAAQAADPAPFNDGRYIIKLRSQGATAGRPAAPVQSDRERGRRAAAAAGGLVVNDLDHQRSVVALLSDEGVARLRQDAEVELVEPDYRRYPQAESPPWGIAMVQANDPFFVTTNAANDYAGMMVCIIDSGYQSAHEDLVDATLSGSGTVTGTLNTGTGNWYEDSCGHGTHVAGTIAAVGDNGVGVVGVNRNGKLNLHIQKVFDGASCAWTYASTLVSALNNCSAAAAAQGRKMVVSMSLGGTGSSTTESNAFQSVYNAGHLSIAAAGNAGSTAVSYPAGYSSVMSVAAVDSAGTVASFSQKNADVEIAAPGVAVPSTVSGGLAPAGCTANCYGSLSGTSMATPHVSGVAALIWSLQPGRTNAEVRNALLGSALDKGTAGRDNSYGYGIVQAKAAYDYLLNPPPPPSYSTNSTSLVFGDQVVNTSATQQVIISNTGASALPVGSITLTSSPTGQFTATNNCGTQVAVNGSCTIIVTFKPTATGAKTGSVVFTPGGLGGAPTTIALSGNATSPPFTLTPGTPIAFGNQSINIASTGSPVTVTNTGPSAFALTVTLTGTNANQFAQTNNCGTSLAAGASCTVNVVFKPTSAGAKSAAIGVTPTGGIAKTVALSGTGIAGRFSLSPTSLAFGTQTRNTTSTAQLVTVTNTATNGASIALGASVFSLTGTNANQFAQNNSNCPTVLAAGASCNVSVTFRPTSAGNKTASLRVAPAGLTAATAALTGTGQ